MSKMNKTYRYPGIYSFETEQSELFFGRENDARKLLDLINIKSTTLLYSKSGVGKSSLINAGLIPLLTNDIIAVRIRFYAYRKGENSPLQKTKTAFLRHYKHNSTWLDNIIDNEGSLWYYMKSFFIQNPDKKCLFVFDQFEELDGYPEKEKNEFKKQLAQLVYSQIPDVFTEVTDELLQDSKPTITKQQFNYFYEKLNFSVLFAIRNDRMSFLNQLSDYLPTIQQNYYELKPLNRQDVYKAIEQPALLRNQKYICHSYRFSTEAKEKIYRFLTNDFNKNIEATQLQIICQTIEKNEIKHRKDKSKAVVEIEHIPDFKNVFKDFYQQAINQLNENEQNKARLLIEEQFIQAGQRISLDGRVCRTKISQKCLDSLVDAHLIRAEPNTTGDFNFELSHDTLIEPILELAEQRQKDEELKQAAIEAEKRKKELDKEKQRRKQLEELNHKIEKEQIKNNKLLNKAKQLIQGLEPGVEVYYKHFAQKAQTDLQNCNFELAAQNYKFAWLAPDLPEKLDVEIKQKADNAELIMNTNNKAIEHYRNFKYADAEKEYRKILDLLPENNVILKRIEYCKNPVFSKDNFVHIKGGIFMMGAKKPGKKLFGNKYNPENAEIMLDEEAQSDEKPHKVQLSDFYMNKYAVTNAEFAEFMNIYGADRIKNGEYKGLEMIDREYIGLENADNIWKVTNEQFKNAPVVRISWYAANEFCNFWGLQLPTEAQWEYAARSGGKNYKYSWGNEIPNTKNKQKFGNLADESLNNRHPEWQLPYLKGYDDGYYYTAPVDAFEHNELGLYQMSGNVFEWCTDWFAAYDDSDEIQIDPIGLKTGQNRVIRGGSWYYPLFNCRVANRNNSSSGNRGSNVGFRPVFISKF